MPPSSALSWRFLCIILRLRMPHLIILPGIVRQKLPMGAGLDDPALVEHQDSVAESAGGKPVADIDGSFISCKYSYLSSRGLY